MKWVRTISELPGLIRRRDEKLRIVSNGIRRNFLIHELNITFLHYVGSLER